MRKLFVLVFAIALCLGVLCFGASADNSVTLEEPDSIGSFYQISTVGELYWFAQEVNNGSTLIDAVLTNDITINEDVLNSDGTLNGDGSRFIPWTPIDSYSGTFDGQGYTIYGLYLSDTDTSATENPFCTGMFRKLEGHSISNLNLADSYVAGVFEKEGGPGNDCKSYIGGICGYVDIGRPLSGCSFNGTVSAVSTKRYNVVYIGGICGFNQGILTSCTFDGSLTAKNIHEKSISSRTTLTSGGGICGGNIGTVKDCKNWGTISGRGYNPAAGGICGDGLTGALEGFDYEIIGTINNCTNYGIISSVTDGEDGNSGHAGGISGTGSGNIESCQNRGSVLGSNYAGGISGTANVGTIIDCTNSAKVEAYYQAAGGICGYSSYSATIMRCTNSGDVELNDGSAGGSTGLGGICGIINAEKTAVVNCYNSGDLSGSQEHADTMGIGGINGLIDESFSGSNDPVNIFNCCSTGKITSNSPPGGVICTGGVNGRLEKDNLANVANCFWLDWDGTGDKGGGAMTEEQFERGEVAYELNGWTDEGYSGKVWKVGENGYPDLTDDNNKVVKVTFVDSNNNILMTCCTNEGDTLKGIGSICFGYATLKIDNAEITDSDLLSMKFYEDTKISVDGRLGYELTATVTGSASKVYDGTTAVTDTSGLRLELSGIRGDDKVSATATYTFDSADVGVGKTITASGITLTGDDAGKYVLESDTVSVEIGTITAKTVIPSISGTVTKVYNGTTDVPDGHGLSIDLEDVVDEDKVSATADYALEDASVGSGKTITATGITLIGEDAGNYTLSSTTVSSNVGEITPKTVTITADDKSAFMGDKRPELSYKADGFIGNDKLTEEPILSCNADMTKAGTYEITVSGGAASDNYKLVYKNGTLTVKQSWIITVKPGNGAADEISYIIPGESFTIPDAPKNGGYIFLGWRCGDETYKAGETIEVTSDMTFTAVWGNLPDVDPEEPEPEPELPFYDVAKGDWFYDAVKYVYYAGLMNGVEEHIFAPNDTLTRAMVWTIIARAEGIDTTGGATWYAKAQQWVVAKGISDGENPSAAITRQELVTMLWRLSGEPVVNYALTAPDADAISGWAYEAMRWAVSEGIIEGDDLGNLNPTANSTRAHAAAFMQRFCTAL